MKNSTKILAIICILLFKLQTNAQVPLKGYDTEQQAYLIVTATYYKDLATDIETDFSAAKGAIVKVTSSTDEVTEKQTQIFNNPKGNKLSYTADFKVNLDSVYSIEVTLNNKTYVVNNYCLKKSWRTHFLYHSTNGTKSPASIFRKQEDPETGILICLYGTFPYINYKALGGNQF